MMIVSLALTLLVGGGSSAPRYRLVDLGSSPSEASIAFDVNERRFVAGMHEFGAGAAARQHAAVWTPGGLLLDLTPGPNYDVGRANSINNAGAVVGWIVTRDAAPEGGFRWRAGQLEFLPTPFQMRAYHVDERGYIGGFAHTPRFQFAPTIWAPDLSYEQYPGLGGGQGEIWDINGWGDTVGFDMRIPTGNNWYAFTMREGVTRELVMLPGHSDSFAFAINVQRVSVGASGPVLGEVAVSWAEDGTIAALPRIGIGASVAKALNDHGEIVGYAAGRSGRMAVLWKDGAAHRLDNLVDNLGTWTLTSAESINERGDIAGHMNLASGGPAQAFLAVRVDGGHPAVIGPQPARSGTTSEVELVGCTPGAVVALYLGLREGDTLVSSCPGTTIEIRNPRVLHGVADANGDVRFAVPMPPVVRGRHVLLQALEVGTCRRTSLSVTRMD